MSAIKLNENQQEIRSEIEKYLEEIHKVFRDEKSEDEIDINLLIKKAGEKAHQLHEELTASGDEPKHHKYMLNNRGVSPEEVNFYEHVHPIEDLLKFIDDTTANNDPIDQTIGEEFNFSVYSNRWGHNDNYKIKRTKDGWDISFALGGVCDKSGYPYLFKNLERDLIEYPSSLGERMKWLWEKAKDKGLTKDQVQEALNELSEWIIELEKSQPVEKLWQGF